MWADKTVWSGAGFAMSNCLCELNFLYGRAGDMWDGAGYVSWTAYMSCSFSYDRALYISDEETSVQLILELISRAGITCWHNLLKRMHAKITFDCEMRCRSFFIFIHDLLADFMIDTTTSTSSLVAFPSHHSNLPHGAIWPDQHPSFAPSYPPTHTHSHHTYTYTEIQYHTHTFLHHIVQSSTYFHTPHRHTYCAFTHTPHTHTRTHTHTHRERGRGRETYSLTLTRTVGDCDISFLLGTYKLVFLVHFFCSPLTPNSGSHFIISIHPSGCSGVWYPPGQGDLVNRTAKDCWAE